VLSETRVSGVHASLKFAEGTLWVVDENSNNGTTVDQVRVLPGQWTRVPVGSTVAFGPVTFAVTVE
jgi:predicted component of type VI protein secretion system